MEFANTCNTNIHSSCHSLRSLQKYTLFTDGNVSLNIALNDINNLTDVWKRNLLEGSIFNNLRMDALKLWAFMLWPKFGCFYIYVAVMKSFV